MKTLYILIIASVLMTAIVGYANALSLGNSVGVTIGINNSEDNNHSNNNDNGNGDDNSGTDNENSNNNNDNSNANNNGNDNVNANIDDNSGNSENDNNNGNGINLEEDNQLNIIAHGRNSEGKEWDIRELRNNKTGITSNDTNAETTLNVSNFDLGDASLGSVLRAYLSNGRYAIIKVLPDSASEKAQEVLRAKCNETNCTIVLKEKNDTNDNNQTLVIYEVTTKKSSHIIGFIPAKMPVSIEINAETGAVLSTHKPWWSFLATEKNE